MRVHRKLLRSASYQLWELETLNGFSLLEHTERLYLKVGEVKFELTNAEEIFIIQEVFGKGLYDFGLVKPCIVFDVGTNVGISALFFAANPKVNKIYGYEPIRDTYDQALSNFGLNEGLAEKIIVHQFGLSDRDEELDFIFDSNHKGLSRPASTEPGNVTATRRSVALRDVANEFLLKMNQFNGEDLILKMDCEGGEYNIVKSLERSGLLPEFNLILMEYHKGYRDLREMLLRNGFTVIVNRHFSKDIGMIYAFSNDRSPIAK